MTLKQQQFIESLMKQREYDLQDTRIQYYLSGMIETTQQASAVIDYLLNCPKVESNPYRALENQIYYVIGHKKVKKHQPYYEAIRKVIGRYPSKNTTYTTEQLEAIKKEFDALAQ